jgi:hypothetical protein
VMQMGIKSKIEKNFFFFFKERGSGWEEN